MGSLATVLLKRQENKTGTGEKAQWVKHLLFRHQYPVLITALVPVRCRLSNPRSHCSSA